MKLEDRIKAKRKELKLTQSEVGSMVGVSRVSIAQWELGDTGPKGKNLYNLAKALKCSTEWLLFGKGEVENVEISNIKTRMVPLISWVQAGEWSDIADCFQPGDADEFYPCIEKHSNSTFSLKVVGDSMHDTYIEGEIIFVDPEVEAVSGDDVVVRQGDNSKATFKRLILGESKKYLQALNKDWPEKHIELLPDAVICGVVIGSYRKRR